MNKNDIYRVVRSLKAAGNDVSYLVLHNLLILVATHTFNETLNV
jgi:hypothetical protein